jgi:hypothetical protein
MLYETAARASEILALNVEQLDLANRRAPGADSLLDDPRRCD